MPPSVRGGPGSRPITVTSNPAAASERAMRWKARTSHAGRTALTMQALGRPVIAAPRGPC